MTGTVLADTGPLYALADPSDQYHQRAIGELDQIRDKNFRIAVHYPVLCESQTLVLRRLGGTYARQWLGELLEGAVLVNPEPADYLSAAALLDRFPDQPITLIDAVTAVLTRRFRIAAWSYDRHFTIMGIRMWPTTR
jgi:predicted nucleic acid-binding protein